MHVTHLNMELLKQDFYLLSLFRTLNELLASLWIY